MTRFTADAGALVTLGHGDVRDVAIIAVCEEVLGLLQVDEAHRLPLVVLCNEDVAVRRLLVEMLDQVGLDALQAIGARAPVGQLEVDETGNQAEDELVVVALGAILLAGRAAAADDSGPLRVQVYTVAAGDTLWQIASRVTTPGEDIRDVVIRLEQLNRMSSVDLRAGEQILIPALG